MAAGTAIKAGKAFVEIGAKDVSGRVVRAFTRRFKNLARTIASLGTVAAGLGIAAGAIATKFIMSATREASSMNEILNRTRVEFKGNAKEAIAWGHETAKAFGRGKTETMKMLTAFRTLTRSWQFPDEESNAMSKALTKLTFDIGSFHDIADEEAFFKLRSGIYGMARSVDSLGANIRITNLERIREIQLGQKLDRELTNQEKILLRIQEIMRALHSAQGDVLATTESYANRVKRLNAAWSDFKLLAGEELLPTMKIIVTGLTNLINQWSSGMEDMKAGTNSWSYHFANNARTVVRWICLLYTSDAADE